ncbi:MAG: hypothetical protein P1U46_04525 [Patescibacteria group bacterium]|nr:hypothetical protein [Patescibacteria group bacterium]
MTIGSFASAGNETLSTASFTSISASEISTQLLNSTLILDIQTDELDVIFFIPSMSFISSSIFSVISPSISVGFTQE